MLPFDFRYAEQFLVALVLTSLTVLVHSAGMGWVRRYFISSHSFLKEHKSFKRYHRLMAGILAIMMGTHFYRGSDLGPLLPAARCGSTLGVGNLFLHQQLHHFGR